MIDLHRHDEFSLYDGFGKPIQLARIAKELGHSALSISNHGTSSGLAEHYFACKDVGIKPILGVEVYFQPTFNLEAKDATRYHLCLFAKNLQGYKNLNRIMTISHLEQKYYKAIVDFKLLEKYHEGIICTSGCIGGLLSKAIAKGNSKLSTKALLRFKAIFGDDFYIEIQPYKLSGKESNGLQERVNEKLIQLAIEHDVECILTSDSHFGKKEDYDSYLKMHETKGREIGKTYEERYIPTEEELKNRFIKMHPSFKKYTKRFMGNLEVINAKIEGDILDQLPLKLPSLYGENSPKIFKQEIIKGLKTLGKYNKEYLDRCKMEADVIESLGFVDYFLIVQDYVKFAKNRNIMVGPGRGSVCNCLIAYALGITKIDSIYFNLDFDRFMRKDKKKVPDIDLDFETERRHEVIEYMVEKYKGYSAQVISYALYKGDNLLNDLFKVCGVESKEEIQKIKKFVKDNIIEDEFDYEITSKLKECKMWNNQYEDIIKHFSKTYKKIKYFGTHAAGIAITGNDLLDYTALELNGGKVVTSYDLGNLELIKVVKFDILGLRTMSAIKELVELTGKEFNYAWCEDEKIMEQFGLGNTDGIFQFETEGAQNILREIEADCWEDVLAGSALNRPGPLSLKMPTQYGHNKRNLDDVKKSPWFRYSEETYGTIVYQEQIVKICRQVGRYEWSEVDRILKVLKGRGRAIKFRDREIEELRVIFYEGAKAGGHSKAEADKIFSTLLIYSFNKGHAAGYGVISIEQMYYKIYYPELFWYITLKYAKEEDRFRFEAQSVRNGNVILLPHVNYEPHYSLQKIESERTLAQGMLNIKNVGEKAASEIFEERKKNGKFKSVDDFEERVTGRIVNVRVLNALRESGALEFDKSVYFSRVKKYNSTLYMKGMR